MAFNRTYSDGVTGSLWYSSYITSNSSMPPYMVPYLSNPGNWEFYRSAPPPQKDIRCRYCDTKSFEGERRCVACGAPL
jgi:hypothetical protein